MQYKQIQDQADRHGEELRAAKAELHELNRTVHRIQAEMAALKEQVREEAAGDSALGRALLGSFGVCWARFSKCSACIESMG